MAQHDLKEEPRRYNPEGDYFEYLKQNHTADPKQENLSTARAQETLNTGALKPVQKRKSATSKPRSYTQAFTAALKGRRKLSPIALVLALLFGGGSIFTAILAPGTTLLALADILDRDLNTQLSAVDKTSAQLWRSKLKQTTTGSCGKVVLRCNFATINTKRMDKTLGRINASSEDKLLMTYDNKKGWGKDRGRIESVTLLRANGEKIEVSTAEDFTRLMKENPEFREKMYMVYSPKFSVYKSKAVTGFLSKMKVSYAAPDKKETKQEMREELDRRVSSATNVDVKKLTPIKDSEGNDTGEFEDDKGNKYTAEEARGFEEMERRIDASPSTSSVTSNIARGLVAGVGTADTLCSVNNLGVAVNTAAKTAQAAQLMRMAFYNVVQPASMIKAEMAYPALVEATSEPLMQTTPANEVADESKISTTQNGDALPKIENPRAGKNATDAEFVKVSSSQDYKAANGISLRTKALLPGGNKIGMFGNVQNMIAKGLGADSPQEITRKCRTIQNTFVRGGALVLGVAVGLGTFGIGTAISVAGSVALGAAMPWLTAQLADIAAGRVTEGLTHTDYGNGITIGNDVMYNGMAREQGMMTMKPEDMADYQNSKREALVYYDELDKLAAARNPFDVTNQFSFAGSLARTTLPVASAMSSGGVQALSSLSMITSSAVTAIVPFAGADDGRDTIVQKDRYTYCNDPQYAELGPNVAVNPTCVMVFGLPKEAMNIDPMENLEWMLANDEIIPDSDSGDPKDNKRDWNYKKYIEQCVDQQPGATEDIEAEPTNGSGCVSDANYEKNWHYAKFKLSLGINEGIDQDFATEGGSEQNFASGVDGPVGQDGWAYPADKEKTTVSSKFGPRGGTNHNGIDIAGPTGTAIYAARDGEVLAAGPASGFGHWIVIRHEDEDGSRVDTVYGHMYPDGVFVKVGDKVTAGQNIATIGNAGQSTGPHLHFEVWKGGHTSFSGSGRPVDPQPYLDIALQGAAG